MTSVNAFTGNPAAYFGGISCIIAALRKNWFNEIAFAGIGEKKKLAMIFLCKGLTRLKKILNFFWNILKINKRKNPRRFLFRKRRGLYIVRIGMLSIFLCLVERSETSGPSLRSGCRGRLGKTKALEEISLRGGAWMFFCVVSGRRSVIFFKHA